MVHGPIEKAACHIRARQHAMAWALERWVFRLSLGVVEGLPERLVALGARPRGSARALQDSLGKETDSLGSESPLAVRLDRKILRRARARETVHRRPEPPAKLRPRPRHPQLRAWRSVGHDHRFPQGSPDRVLRFPKVRATQTTGPSLAALARARCVAEGGIRVDPVRARLGPVAWLRFSGRRPPVDVRPPRFPQSSCSCRQKDQLPLLQATTSGTHVRPRGATAARAPAAVLLVAGQTDRLKQPGPAWKQPRVKPQCDRQRQLPSAAP
jgi:hypothetical protein